MSNIHCSILHVCSFFFLIEVKSYQGKIKQCGTLRIFVSNRKCFPFFLIFFFFLWLLMGICEQWSTVVHTQLPVRFNFIFLLTGTTLKMQPCCQPTLPLVSHQTDLGFRRAQNPNSIHEPNGNLWQWKQIWNWDYVSKGIVKVWISWRKGCPHIHSRFSSTSHSADKADVLCTSN